MLARLEAVEGVAEARVEATGRVFALVLEEGASEEVALAGAASALRRPPRRLAPADAAAELARRGAGDRWYGRAEAPELCFLEARMLAARGAVEVGAAVGLEAAERARVEGALREVLFVVMERVLAQGGRDSSGWIQEEWPALAAAVAARCAPGVAPERRGRVAAALAALHAPACAAPR